jgi:hypothetical protein
VTIEGSWEIVPNTDGKYEVNPNGDVRRRISGRKLKAGELIKPCPNSDGYPCILGPVLTTGVRRKEFKIHRIVAEVFIGPCPGGLEVNHKDGNKTNNSVDNLEYVSHAENMKHAANLGLIPAANGRENSNVKLTEDQVREIRTQHKITGMGSRTLSKHLGLPHGAVYGVLYLRSWRCLT